MSLSGASNFVASDEDLELHRLFDLNNGAEVAADGLPLPAEDLAPPRLASPFAGPLEDLQGQPVGWLSPSAAGTVDGLNTINFDDFLALDESTDTLSAPTEEASAAPPSGLADSSTPQDEPATASEPAEDLPAAAQLEAARDEIAQLKTALAAESLQLEVLTTPGGRQSSSSPRKRKAIDGEVSPPKRQTTTEIGPIEALWSPKVTEDGRCAVHNNLAPPMTPKPCSPQPDFIVQPYTPYINTPTDCAISPQDLHSIQTFLNDNPALVYGTPQQVEISTPLSDITMGHPVNMKVERAPLKHTLRRVPKNISTTTNKVTKKTKTTPKKTQRQRTASTSTITPSPDTSKSHRSIDELLAANFYSLNAQEKIRVMLPMLRNLDPRELEKSLAELPCIQAKGAGHEVRVARAIHDSPPTPENDDILATKLTFGTPPSPTPAAKRSTTSSPAPAVQASPLSHKVAHVEVIEDHGAVRQREAL